MNKELQFLVYRSADEDVSVDAIVKDETVWLTQKGMAELFGVQTPAISKHLKNIFEENELDKNSVVSKMEITAFSCNSLVSKMFFRCLLIAGTFTPNKAAMVFCVSQNVPFSK